MQYSNSFTFEEDDVPTFVNYLKMHGEDIRDQLSIVKKIWFPIKYPNYQLITEKYKLSIRVNFDNRAELANLVDYYISNCYTMAVQITDPRTRSYMITDLPSELVIWQPMGEYGYRCEIQEKPVKAKNGRTTKK